VIDAFGGVPMGGTLIAQRLIGDLELYDLKCFLLQKEPEGYGPNPNQRLFLATGLELPINAVLIEDVVSTGGSVAKWINYLNLLNGDMDERVIDICGVISFVHRSDVDPYPNLGVHFSSVLTMSEIINYHRTTNPTTWSID